MDKELKLKTSWKPKTTTIHFGRNFALEKALTNLLEKTEKRVAIITDHHLEKLYRSEIEHLDLKIFSIEPGETSKSRESKEMLEDHLLSHNFGRDSLLIALGGGVTGDIAGFLASTYCRGIPYFQIPTSLLAMVDSSVGGKTGVNTPYGKNMIGAFNPPEEVWIDVEFLKTLPDRQWAIGIVEMIKAGLIASPSLFNALKTHHEAFKNRDLDFILDRVFESVAIKKEIVEEDPEEEKGIRRMLNLGHTFGHALEVMEHYTLDHGSAVAIGTMGSCYASHQLGFLSTEEFNEIRELFELYQIPLTYHSEHGIDEWMSQLVRDKKALMGTPRIVMIDTIGNVIPFDGEYCDELDFSILDQTLNWMHEQFYRPS